MRLLGQLRRLDCGSSVHFATYLIDGKYWFGVENNFDPRGLFTLYWSVNPSLK